MTQFFFDFRTASHIFLRKFQKVLFKYQTGRTLSYLSSGVHSRVVKACTEMLKVVSFIIWRGTLEILTFKEICIDALLRQHGSEP